jgi:hypothetical protein
MQPAVRPYRLTRLRDKPANQIVPLAGGNRKEATPAMSGCRGKPSQEKREHILRALARRRTTF